MPIERGVGTKLISYKLVNWRYFNVYRNISTMYESDIYKSEMYENDKYISTKYESDKNKRFISTIHESDMKHNRNVR